MAAAREHALSDAAATLGVVLEPIGIRVLPLSRAVALAASAGVSLEFLAGLTSQAGAPPAAAAGFDIPRWKARLLEIGVSEKAALAALHMQLGPYRRLMSGRDEPTLGQMTQFAGIVHTTVSALLTNPSRERTQP